MYQGREDDQGQNGDGEREACCEKGETGSCDEESRRDRHRINLIGTFVYLSKLVEVVTPRNENVLRVRTSSGIS